MVSQLNNKQNDDLNTIVDIECGQNMKEIILKVLNKLSNLINKENRVTDKYDK